MKLLLEKTFFMTQINYLPLNKILCALTDGRLHLIVIKKPLWENESKTR